MKVHRQAGVVVLASGHLADVSAPGGSRARTATMLRCPWLIEVPSGNPEPDSPADLVMVIECGALMRDDAPDGMVCDHGHAFGNSERRYAPGGEEWQREQRERLDETGMVWV